mgnify:CR=1 FL=1
MMYLTEPNLKSVVWKQYVCKLKSLSGIFPSLMVVQVLSFALSLGGTGSSGTGYGGVSIHVRYFSGELISQFTFWWAIIVGFWLTIKNYRETDFFFVTNRLASHLSTIVLLLTASLYAGITVPLLGFFLRLVVYWRNMNVILNDVAPSPDELLMSLLVTAGYAALFSCLGYAAGMLFQLSEVMFSILLGTYIGLSFTPATSEFIQNVHRFYNAESSVLLFTMKVALTLCLVYAFIIFLTNRLEVRR